MDYSKVKANIEASEASDFVYAKWYEKQPVEKKMSMVISGYNFVANQAIRLMLDNIESKYLMKDCTLRYCKNRPSPAVQR